MTDESKKHRGTLKRTKIGVVISDKRDKTRTIAVNYQIRHPKYGKYLKRQSHIHVHDPDNQSKLGDQVEIVGCRPTSKTKSWRLVRIVKAAPALGATHVDQVKEAIGGGEQQAQSDQETVATEA